MAGRGKLPDRVAGNTEVESFLDARFFPPRPEYSGRGRPPAPPPPEVLRVPLEAKTWEGFLAALDLLRAAVEGMASQPDQTQIAHIQISVVDVCSLVREEREHGIPVFPVRQGW